MNDFLAAIADPPPRRSKFLDAICEDPSPTPHRRTDAPAATGDRPGDLWAAQTSWPDDLLVPDGWTLLRRDAGGEEHWVRPDKDPRKGSSATLYHKGSDVLKVFSTSLGDMGIEADQTYTKFGYLAATRYGGDHSAAARALREQGYRVGPVDSVPVDPVTGEIGADDRDDDGSHLLPPEFWAARPVLGHIRAAAHARTRSGDVVLHSVLARVAGQVPHTLKLPPLVGTRAPLNYFAVLAGPPASGKSSGWRTACELAPADRDVVVDGLPIGSGEGLVESLFETVKEEGPDGKQVNVKRQTKWNAIVYVDEGEVLASLGSRSGSTVLATLRTVWSGGTLGQANASAERRRIVPSGQYAYGVVLGLQPSLAGPLLDDAAAGTPQRFGWAWATDPSIPDHQVPWPGPLDLKIPTTAELGTGDWTAEGYFVKDADIADAVVEEIRAWSLAVARGEIVVSQEGGHAHLLRLKMAALLGVLDGRVDVSTEDWELAGVVLGTSNAVRRKVADAVAADLASREQATKLRLARRAVEADTAVADSRVERAARQVAEKVARAGGELLSTQVRRSCSANARSVFEEAVALAVEQGWITEADQPGQGAAKRVLRSSP